MSSRSSVVFQVNSARHEVTGENSFLTLSDYLRYEQGLTGTKVVCAEGDCGACTVLMASVHELEAGRLVFKSVNSCILPVLSLDGCFIVTVEGLKKQKELHPIQKSMLENFGSQCGYCTPGFVCAMAAMTEDAILRKKSITEKRVKNNLTGNLCRCTGYEPIVKAALTLDLQQIETLQSRYHNAKTISEFKKLVKKPVLIENKESRIFLPVTLPQALAFKRKNPEARIVAGATDLGVAVNKGRTTYQSVMSLQNISDLRDMKIKKNGVEIPARATLAGLQDFFEKKFPEMGSLLHIFASPQIKNSGTVVGNVLNASPIADTIPFFLVNDAMIEARRVGKKRLIPIGEFYLGYKKLNLKPDEIVTKIHLPVFKGSRISKLYKVSLRKDLDISAVTMAVQLSLKENRIEKARLAFGGVGPVVLRLPNIEAQWTGKVFDPKLFEELSKQIHQWVSPISDVRGSKEFRLLLCRNLLLKMAAETRGEAAR